MFVKYENYIGELVKYEKLEDDNIIMDLRLADNIIMKIACRDWQITIPNILGNSHVLYELQKEQDKQKAEGE